VNRRRHARCRRRHHRRHDYEAEHAHVHAEVEPERQRRAGHRVRDQADAEPRQKNAARGAGQREDRDLGPELRRDPAT
jgi:hypothetical protein